MRLGSHSARPGAALNGTERLRALSNSLSKRFFIGRVFVCGDDHVYG